MSCRIGSPLRKSRKVGIDRTPYLAAIAWLCLDVEADDAQVVALSGERVEDRVHRAARRAPGGPEVDEDGDV